jgi:isoquinoline 1-oxidoreductase subunit beta
MLSISSIICQINIVDIDTASSVYPRRAQGGTVGMIEMIGAAAGQGISRRAMLRAGVAAGASLLIGGTLARAAGGTEAVLNAWVRISADDQVTLITSQSEMGQGITTTLPAILADELGADWGRIRVESAPFAPAYRHPVYHWMFTGNSESISALHDLMRAMGASARHMLIAAAAQRLGAAPEALIAEDGVVRHPASGRAASFGALAADAEKIPPPAVPPLKPETARRLVGRALPRLDIPAKVDGSAVFGIDVTLPGMLHAAVRCAPVFGGRLERYDAADLRARPGVVAVVEVPGGLAVVGETWWQARQALDAADLTFSAPPPDAADSAALAARYREALEQGPFRTHLRQGDPERALAAGRTLGGTYALPFQAHAALEPINCTAHVTASACDIFVPTQGVELTLGVARQVTGLAAEDIRIHRTLIGGGFGRRLLADFVKQTLIVARAVGRPVKLIWSREEDFAHDFYRPAMLHRITASLGDGGEITALAHRVVSPSHLLYVFPRAVFPALADWTEPAAPPAEYDPMAVEGVVGAPYAVPHLLVEQRDLDLIVPVSVWRTTGHGPNNFALESFIDEVAAATGQDPLALRRKLLVQNARALRLLDAVAERAGWGTPLPKGHGRGLAFAAAFGGLIAQVAELSVEGRNIRLKRITSAVDCGRVLDPGIAAANIEGGIVWGLSALRTEITFADGRAVESNFDGFDPLHLREMPQIVTHFIDSGEKLGGLGEIGPVPTGAAVANALFAATGERIRALPLSTSGFTIT